MTPAELRTWRRFHNLTQKQAAKMVGISTVTWKRYERDGATVPVSIAGSCWALERGWRKEGA